MKMKKWIYTLIIVFAALITLIGIIMLINQNSVGYSENKIKSESKKDKHIHIAIVNEDKQTTYNGKKINLGKPFIERLSNQDKYKFDTVSRSIAEHGLKQGTYQVMIVIPENFSEMAMQLDEKTPSKLSLQ
ncbi:YhgE/Pip domain-containing protein, partial [Staphylococcus sp. 231237_7MaSpsaltlick]